VAADLLENDALLDTLLSSAAAWWAAGNTTAASAFFHVAREVHDPAAIDTSSPGECTDVPFLRAVVGVPDLCCRMVAGVGCSLESGHPGACDVEGFDYLSPFEGREPCA
jgi:hypothetical protein